MDAQAEQQLEEEIKQLKAKVQEKKVVIGTERVLKGLKGKTLQKVFVTKNCPKKTKEDVLYYAQLANIPVKELEQSNEELGIICKKGFFISVLGIAEG